MTISSNNPAKPDTIDGLDGPQQERPAVKEVGGFADKKLPEPTRYGDWEVGGRCSDF